ncbi:hypothetical protein DEM27_10595 [Metarhizobium album]|uniref:DUF1351 domain-containing protein n=1 Tax=Metarhizobium album TaxID=2182425 RepID=A0A2U2DU19_9HYPH|nr:hypothetical protein [Rhizobium album]PWE56802.1 hypothetical protein DEM27_10595 [Rhizobium album]
MSAIAEKRDIIDIAAMVEADPGCVLLDEDLYAQFIADLKAGVKAFVPDLSTATSRKKIASEAYAITRKKTAIDEAGKKMNEDRRKEINIVDAKRRAVKADLDEIAADARRPLDQWEAQEEARIDYCKSILKHIEDCGNGFIGGEPQAFGILLHELEEKIVINSELGEFEEQARVAHKIALDKVKAAFEAHKRAEADRIELEKLRAEKEERDRAEAARLEKERIAKEAADREAREKAEYAENVRRQAEAAERAQKEAAERERRAVEAARLEAEQKAQAAIAKAEAEARAIKEAAERAEQERQAAAKREQEEREARERDREHRGKIMSEAKQAIMAQGVKEDVAKKIVLAVIAGEVPHIKMEF